MGFPYLLIFLFIIWYPFYKGRLKMIIRLGVPLNGEEWQDFIHKRSLV